MIFFRAQSSLWSNSHIHIQPLEKHIALVIWTFVGTVMSLLFNMLSRFVITFVSKSKSFNYMASLIVCRDFGIQEAKSATLSTFSPSICNEVMGPDVKILVF